VGSSNVILGNFFGSSKSRAQLLPPYVWGSVGEENQSIIS